MKTKLFLACMAVTVLLAPRILADGEQGDDNPTGVSGIYNGNITSGGSYDPYTGNAIRAVDDIVVPGSVGAYPLKWTRYFNSHLTWRNNKIGGAWRFSYINYSLDYSVDSNGAVLTPDGRTIPTTFPYGIEEWIEQPSPNTTILHMPDGGQVLLSNQQHFGQVTYTTAPHPVQVIDPYGQITTISYVWFIANNSLQWKLDKITEPAGRYLQLNWDTTNSYITSVQAFDGIAGHTTPIQTVTYTWTTQTLSLQNGNGHPNSFRVLTRADYSDGASANYTYTEGNYPVPICSYPFGTDYWYTPLLASADDVRYNGPMRQIAYQYYTTKNTTRISSEKNFVTGDAVSTITGVANNNSTTTATETRGDGPTRTFNYYSAQRCADCPPPGVECSDPTPTDGKLSNYTDFLGHTTTLNYETDATKASAGFITSVVDANGNTITYTRSTESYAILHITHPDGSHMDQTYTDEANPYYLASRTDENTHRTDYARDSNNRITRKDFPADTNGIREYETFTYNSFGQTLTHRMKNGAYEHFNYDSRGLLLAKTNPTWTSDWATSLASDPQTTFTYYTSADYSGVWTDRVKAQTDPRGIITQIEYDRAYDANGENSGLPSGSPVGSRGLVTRISYPQDTHTGETPTYPSGTYQSFGYDKYGNKLWRKDELLNKTSYTYDDYRRVLTITNPLNKTVTNTYTPTNGTNTSPYVHTTNSIYTTTTPTGVVTKNIYDANLRKTSTTQGFGTALAATTMLAYDPVGNPTSVTDPLNHTTTTVYDTRNRKITETDALNQSTQWFYDAVSNILHIVRKDGTQQDKTYDEMNRLLTDTVPQTNTINVTTTFNYYPGNVQYGGLMKQVIDADGHITMFTAYDPSGLKTLVTYPNNDTHGFTYDNDKNLTARRTVNGTTQNFSYDMRNRKLTMWWTDASPPAANFTAEWDSFLYEAAGRLSYAQNGSGGTVGQGTIYSTITRQYDAAGRLILDGQNLDPTLGEKDVQYSYDDDGKDTRLYLTSAGYDYTFSYDAMGRFEKILPTGGAVTFQYKYDAASNEVERDNIANGVNQIYTRDALNRMSERDVKLNTTVLSSEAYGYDPMSRMLSTLREDGKTDAFTYYLDGELWTANYGATGRNVSYNIDQMGNRSSVVDTGTTTNYTQAPGGLNQYLLVGTNVVGNGSEHEIALYQNIAYGYVNDERLASISGNGHNYALVYDALGRCVKRTLDNAPTFYIYDCEKPIVEYNSAGSVTARNLYGKGIDEILMRIDATLGRFYYQDDHEGSVTHLMNSTGGIIENYRYDVFGAPTINGGALTSSAFGNRFLFTGREYTSTFGIYEYRARAYHPGLGRFTGEDPKGFDAGDYNLFRYCHNDPEDLTDAMGLASDEESGMSEAFDKAINAYNDQYSWLGPAAGLFKTEQSVSVVRAGTGEVTTTNPRAGDKYSVAPFRIPGKPNLADVHVHTYYHKYGDEVTKMQFSWKDIAYGDLSGTKQGVAAHNPYTGQTVHELFIPDSNRAIGEEFWGGRGYRLDSKSGAWSQVATGSPGGSLDLRNRTRPTADQLASFKKNFKAGRAVLNMGTGAEHVEPVKSWGNKAFNRNVLVGDTGESDGNFSQMPPHIP